MSSCHQFTRGFLLLLMRHGCLTFHVWGRLLPAPPPSLRTALTGAWVGLFTIDYKSLSAAGLGWSHSRVACPSYGNRSGLSPRRSLVFPLQQPHPWDPGAA